MLRKHFNTLPQRVLFSHYLIKKYPRNFWRRNDTFPIFPFWMQVFNSSSLLWSCAWRSERMTRNQTTVNFITSSRSSVFTFLKVSNVVRYCSYQTLMCIRITRVIVYSGDTNIIPPEIQIQ
uniref:Uncharacterized protein n=1 Tax=Molossus molossus TaxID=27622 RepID=A0A7J8B7Y7_MOLMO|nr:hypothetical protein HJG59_010735 [Molossus molossus]